MPKPILQTCTVCGIEQSRSAFRRKFIGGVPQPLEVCLRCEGGPKHGTEPHPDHRLRRFEPEIDWSIYNKFLPDEVTCRCGYVWHTHTQYFRERVDAPHNKFGKLIARQPCRVCGRTDLITAVRSAKALWIVSI